ncbi:MAG: phosphatidylglycerophosphatase A [Gammaproteobacteria bacterium HGW-Gammaproteobacteria-10]|nr:MAG: phosphatidylglycerophosphatase A [Gammaproteobacteria bacterium HGW-Gammaproteobacteria-10]
MSIFLTDKIGKNELTAKTILTDPVLFLAFGFGSGLFKKAPGTMGTVAAIPVCWLFALAGNYFYYALTLAAVVAGIGICGMAAKKLGEHDFGGIVWDEVAGLLVTMCWVPFSWSALLVGFVLFRLFDIVKPWPIIWVDRKVSGGFGIMLDDILAGILSGVILLIIVDMGWL